jgi:FtsP/CotA-like multicopper oxidase with cupredoxin domain
VQLGNGLYGPIKFNGPSSAAWDIDLGHVFLADWGHTDAFEVYQTAKLAITSPPAGLESNLVSGMNTFDCGNSTDPNCTGQGKKYELTFTPGKKHRLRVVNSGVTGDMQFSIDGHSLTVMASDFVPIKPYTAQSIQVALGQRYDVVVEANAASGDYWLRGGWGTACDLNGSPDDLTAIVRYDASSTAAPTSVSSVTASNTCLDESLSNLVPALALDVTQTLSPLAESLNISVGQDSIGQAILQWTFNGSSLDLDWGNPTLQTVFAGGSSFPADYNVVPVTGDASEWAVLVIKNESPIPTNHPIHFHGHDFWILSQATTPWDGTTAGFNLNNPPRRDVASLPQKGHLAIAFQLDNPGAWLVHCHIAWHASSGFALELLENISKFTPPSADKTVFSNTCTSWTKYEPTDPDTKQDSGI